ncbi:hypothetical protein [Occallatibacter savannae]|uniref:hypothetical protein n=1 Tax=Occallatibacter savannae TaxID=1002691 RepID=UPI000D6A0046|nr:hypothetical protein [Occallatibacter savannae]
MLKSIGIVLGSYILSIVLVLGTDPILSRIFPGDFEKGHIPSNPALIASTACFVVVSILCAWVCARFAPRNPSKHVLWFFALGEAMGLAFTIPNWSTGWPHWYWISWLLTWPISCWIGLKLAARSSAASRPPLATAEGQ